MIYDFKVLFSPEGVPEVKDEINNSDLKISESEISKIEEVETSLNSAEMENLIDQSSKEFLTNVMSEGQNILQQATVPENEKIRAMYSILKAQQIMYPGSITGNINLRGEMSKDGLLTIVGNNPEGFKAILGAGTDILVAHLQEKQQAVIDAVASGTDVSESADGIISLEKAKLYMKTLLSNVKGETVTDMYKDLLTHFDDPNFKSSIDALINNICADNVKITEMTLDFDKNHKSSKIRAFQEAMLKEYRNDLGYNGRNGVDGQLGAKTLGVILKASGISEFEYNLKGETVLGNVDERLEITNTGAEHNDVPDNLVSLEKFGEFVGRDFKFFTEGNNDCVQASPKFPNDLFVKIGGVKYYLGELTSDNPDAKNNPKKFRQIDRPYMGYNEENQYVQLVGTRLCFGEFDGDNLIDGTEIVLDKDGNQVKSTLTGPKVGDGDSAEQLMFTKIRGEKVTENEGTENETSRFEAKWRIEFGDTKRMNDTQLDALLNDNNALNWVLEQSIKAYDETNHKPSEIGRYNLSHIVVGVLKKLDSSTYDDIVNNELKGMDERKWIVQKFFGLKHGMFSNPEHKIHGDKDKTYPSRVGNIDVSYVEEQNQGDRIHNALSYLKALVENNKKEVPSA